MSEKLMSGLLTEVAASSDHPRPDFWVWALIPAIGFVGSLLVLAAGVAARPLLGVRLGLWVWIAALVVPTGLFIRDVLRYHTARRRGRRAGWELRITTAAEAGKYLRQQNARLTAGTVRVGPVTPEPGQRYARLRSGKKTALLPLEATVDQVRWLESPGGERVEVEKALTFLRRAYRLRKTGRRAFVPKYMRRAEYDEVVGFLVDCGLLDDGGAAGRQLVLPTLSEAEAHLGLGGQQAQPGPPRLSSRAERITK